MAQSDKKMTELVRTINMKQALNKISRSIIRTAYQVARDGFEPPQSVPKTEVLPLDDRAIAAAKISTKIYFANIF